MKLFNVQRTSYIVLAFILFSLFSILPISSQAQTPDPIAEDVSGYSETIDGYKVDLTINSDSSIDVIEEIDYNFHSLQKHGIIRHIPYSYDAGGYNRTISISNSDVTIDDGSYVNFETSKSGGNYIFKVGDANELITGPHKYNISYTVRGVMNYFKDHDELYWNAIGGEWPASIQNAEVAVHFPAVEKSTLTTACYSGYYGEKRDCATPAQQITAGSKVSGVTYGEPDMPQGNSLTVVIGLPKGTVSQPSIFENVFLFLMDNWAYLLPILVLIVMCFLWWTRGRDPKGRGTIIAEYEAPDDLTPVEVGTLYDQKADNHDVSGEIIYLATKGYLKITQLGKSGVLGKMDYRIDLLKAYSDVSEIDQKLLNDLFSHGLETAPGVLRSVKISELKEKFNKELSAYTDTVYQQLVNNKYFPSSPAKTKGIYISIGIGTAFVGIAWLASVPIVISGIIIALFGSLMGKRTKLGADALEKIKGLKLFLEVTEKERIKFHNAPEKNPQLFEKFLPYAMVLGVEGQWAGQFADIYKQQPDWYSSNQLGMFNAILLTNSLHDFSDRTGSNMAAVPASRGSSGFGGGGFSGGGFGGGGGGSW